MENSPTVGIGSIQVDNWVHRSSGMQCNTCMWYVEKSGGKGHCRRHAPTLSWPVTFDSDFCGEHKLA